MNKLLLVVLLATAMALPARAQGLYPDEYALRPLQLPASMGQARIPLVIDLSRGNAGKLIFMPFDFRLGVSSDLELRLFQPVHGLCLRGCGKAYDDLAFGMLYSLLRQGGVEASLLAALEVRSFTSPAQLALDAGAAFKLIRAPFSLSLSPYLGIGLSDRSDRSDWINIPIEGAVQLTPPTALFVETGLYGDVHDSSGWSGPLGVGVNYLAAHGVDLGAELKWNSILGHTDTGSRLLLGYIMLRN